MPQFDRIVIGRAANVNAAKNRRDQGQGNKGKGATPPAVLACQAGPESSTTAVFGLPGRPTAGTPFAEMIYNGDSKESDPMDLNRFTEKCR